MVYQTQGTVFDMLQLYESFNDSISSQTSIKQLLLVVTIY